MENIDYKARAESHQAVRVLTDAGFGYVEIPAGEKQPQKKGWLRDTRYGEAAYTLLACQAVWR